ncbi:MAG: 2,4-dienoyl-CoA reductase-like NADH-dependent reductase (Old Yellow Enzyme family) [Bacteroidia bacterium]|jgi:2,4-dienoyl-CoA reductase-like NADH-dependent reductase (Old Yellow Enzyme family)
MTDINSLFRPFNQGSLSMDNRIVMAPMTRNASPDNVPGDRVVEYYRRRAAGGTGLIITEGTCIDHPAANCYADAPNIHGTAALAGWQRVVDAVHAEGGKIAAQLWHVGAMRKAGMPPTGDVDGYSPSGMNMPGKITRRIMSESDIQEAIASYARGAATSKALGFDAVEIHGAHGYLIDQFFWAGTNVRDDAYGGSMENRGRFCCEVIEAVRNEVGPDYPVILRYSQWKQQEYDARLAETPEELDAFLAPLSNAGVDVFHCSTRRFWEAEFAGSDLNLAGWTKKLTGKPTITVGSVGLDADFIPLPGEATFREAAPAGLDRLLEMLQRDEFDLVAVGRAMIANPDWAEQVRADNIAGLRSFEKEQLFALE